MKQTFKKRAAEIADHAYNPRGAVSEGADFLRGLDETERIRELTQTCIFSARKKAAGDQGRSLSIGPRKHERRAILDGRDEEEVSEQAGRPHCIVYGL